MSTIIGPAQDVRVRIVDAASDQTITYICRQPTAEEQFAYQRESIRRRKGKVHNAIPEALFKYGAKLVKGFEERTDDGSWALLYADGGEPQPVSSDPNSDHYREDWLELIKTYRPAHLQAVAGQMLDGTDVLDESDEAGAGN